MLEQLNEVVASQMQIWAVPGVSIGLLHNGEIDTATSGIGSIETETPVTPKMLFQIGSISTIFTWGTSQPRKCSKWR
jgi:CubicO group peptidase (beta-lactamase class C family)